jgi:hypothetical protein
LEIFNELWDVLSPRQRGALAHYLSLLLLSTREDENHPLRQSYLAGLRLEFVFPIQDPANVARFLAMLEGMGADVIAELIQMIHPIEFIMPDFGMDLVVHNVSSSSASDSSSNADE